MAFNEALHPRVPAGATGGGEFGKAGNAKATSKSAKPAPAKPRGLRSNLSYNASTGRGAGYGTPSGDPQVKKLQQALNRLGLTDSKGRKLAVDGKLGPLTTQAIKAEQKRLGLKTDGIVTPAFFAKIGAAKSAPAAKRRAVATMRTPAVKPKPKPAAKPATKAAPKPAKARSRFIRAY